MFLAADSNPLPIEAPSLRELFLAFSGVAIIGFGGVLPWARRMLVEERRWLSAEEFNEVYSLAQFLPGGNILNLAVVVGQRSHGALGSLVCVVALLAGPVAIMTLLGFLYTRYGQIAAVHDALAGVAAAAAGLDPGDGRQDGRADALPPCSASVAIAIVAFVAVAVAELPLFMVLAVLVPLGIGLAWRGML